MTYTALLNIQLSIQFVLLCVTATDERAADKNVVL